MPKVYAYIRVSTEEQAASGMGLPAQRRRAEAYFEYMITRDEYSDHGWGGVITERAVSAFRVPFLQRKGGAELHQKLEKGDHILFLRLDRAFRSVKDFLGTYELWEARGINVHFLDLGVDMSTANGRLTLTILASVAQWESEVKSERVKAALAERKLNGRQYCHYTGFGFKSEGKFKVIVPDREQIVTMRYIAHLREYVGETWVGISKRIEAIYAEREGRKARMEWDADWKRDKVRRAYKAFCELRTQDGWRTRPLPSWRSG